MQQTGPEVEGRRDGSHVLATMSVGRITSENMLPPTTTFNHKHDVIIVNS